MRRTIAIAWRMLLAELKDPKSFLPWLLVPVMFTFVFGYSTLPVGQGGQRRYDVAVAALEDQALTARFVAQLQASPSLDATLTTEAILRRQVRDGSVVAGLIVPEGFAADLLAGRPPRYTLVRQSESDVYLYAREEAGRAATRLVSAVVAADLGVGDRTSPAWLDAVDRTLARWADPALAVTVTPVVPPGEGAPLRQVDQKAIGFTLMILLMSVMVSSGAILAERATGTWPRLLATPATRSEIMGGYLAGYFVVGWVQFLAIVGLTWAIFRVDWGDPLGLFVLGSLFIVVAGALGLAVAGFARTVQQQSAITSLLGIVTAMLAGLFWPLETVPHALQVVARAMPQYWAGLGFTNIIARGLDWRSVGAPALVLAAMAAVFLAIGIGRVRYEP